MPMPIGRAEEREMTIPQYRKMKIKLLEKEFMVPVTKEEKNHLNTLETEPAIDRYCRTLLKNFWN